MAWREISIIDDSASTQLVVAQQLSELTRGRVHFDTDPEAIIPPDQQVLIFSEGESYNRVTMFGQALRQVFEDMVKMAQDITA